MTSWTARIAALDRAHLALSNSRLLVAAGTAVMLWLAVGRDLFAPWWLLVPLAAFVLLVAGHARTLARRDRARRARRWYEIALDRLAGRWPGSAPARDGTRFADGHRYARDLDLFGRASLFELLNVASTEAGEETLARWIGGRAGPAETLARQQAVDDLRAMLDWREDLAVLASEARVGRTTALATWAAAAPAGFGAGAAWLFLACAATTAALVALVVSRPEWLDALLVWLAVEYAVVFFSRERVRGALGGIELAERDLTLLAQVLERVERQPFRAARLQALRDALSVRGAMPSRIVRHLRRLIAVLDSTRNEMFAPIAYPLMVRSLTAVAIDRWRTAYGAGIVGWIDVVGEFDALACLAAYAYEHPSDPFPEIAAGTGGPLFDAAGLAHPLIDASVAVPNDVHLAGGAQPRSDHGPEKPGRFNHALIVSGSNMSGKSTLLRAIGLNVVLAQAGAPVRAARLRLSPLALGTTIRIEDSLQAGQSRFYAEILRIRDILGLTGAGVPVLFLLDEILHGTNSHDRRIGAAAIVRALVAAGAIGLVTTHDLALTELTTGLDGIANVHFEDRVEDGRMVFDYRMRPGVVAHSNALTLMRALGIDV